MPEAKSAPGPDDQEYKFREPWEDAAYDAWFREQVQFGLDQAERGQLISNEQIELEW